MWIYPANPILWFDWYTNPVPELVPMAESGILSAVEIDSPLSSCTELATYMLFCGYHEAGCKLLEAVVKLQVHKAKSISEREKLILEVIWSTKPDLRSADVPWQPFTTQEVEQKRGSRRASAATPEPYRPTPDLKKYEDTEVPTLVEVCRNYLNQPGKWPHDNARNAFDAMQKLHELLPGWMPITHSWSLEVELALYLGAQETRGVIERVLKLTDDDEVELQRSRDRSWMGDCLCFDEFVPVSSSLPSGILKMSSDQANVASSILIKAINARIKDGQRTPLQSLSWRDLLNRLANAVFARYPDKWERAEDILFPPASQEEIDTAEEELGMPLPEDFKEMVAVHNGFDGGEDFLCGGNCGLADLMLEDTENVEDWLFVLRLDQLETDDQGQIVEHYEYGTVTGSKIEPQLIGIMQKADHEGSRPFIVPHTTWKGYGDPQAEEGEYRYIHAGVRENLQWPNIRQYVGEQVLQFEVDVAIRAALKASTTESAESSSSSVKDPEVALQKDTFWKTIKDIVKQRTNSATTGEEAAELFKRIWTKRQREKSEGGEAADGLSLLVRGPGLSVEEALYDDSTQLGKQIDAEKMMQTDNLWNILQGWIVLEVKDKKRTSDIVELFRSSWEERSRRKKRSREEGE